MPNIESKLSEDVVLAIKNLYTVSQDPIKISFQKTNPEFDGDFTLVVFPFLKISAKKPEDTAADIGKWLLGNSSIIKSFNVVKGFLNLVLKDEVWINFFKNIKSPATYGVVDTDSSSPLIMLEYSSPNTNKPLHLGHIRNNLLGHSLSEILRTCGNRVMKVNLVNDRGIHICKSMLAWKRWGNEETPQSTGLKGDHLVGKYYVEFDKHYKKEILDLVNNGMSKEEAEKESQLIKDAQEMLRKWESGNKEVMELWKMMNSWVYEGFNQTYKTLGISFDKTYYESNTYLLGKEVVKKGLDNGVLVKKQDNSVWIDLTAEGLDMKVLLRSDGTSVYMTQDLGTAIQRHEEEKFDKLIYVVGNEQDYHFKVLFKALKKLGYDWADGLFHLSYGMVELPEGKMKSREGTVVDADDLINEMIDTARETTEQLGKVDDFSEEQARQLNKQIGLGALKYFMLKVDPKKKMLFNPKESIDFNGNTGPFIQYTHARICSVIRKSEMTLPVEYDLSGTDLNIKEKALICRIYEFPSVILQAGKGYDPGLIANYVYELAKDYNQFYHDCPIIKEDDPEKKRFRLSLSWVSAAVINNSLRMLGIESPERM